MLETTLAEVWNDKKRLQEHLNIQIAAVWSNITYGIYC